MSAPQIIIGVAGLAGSGKSTIAAMLQRGYGFSVESLADPIKAICAATFGWSQDVLYGPSSMREQPDPAWDGLTPRKALQLLGTEWGRACHQDVWVRTLLRELAEPGAPRRVVIPDVRFQNEVDAIVAAGGTVVRKWPAPPWDRVNAHESEASIFGLVNLRRDCGHFETLERLGAWVDELCADLGISPVDTPPGVVLSGEDGAVQEACPRCCYPCGDVCSNCDWRSKR